MEIRKIDEVLYGEYLEQTLELYKTSGDHYEYMFSYIDRMSRPVICNGKSINIDINIDKYLEVEKAMLPQAEKEIIYTQMLYDDFRDVPSYILLDKYVWAYLNIKVFGKLIVKHYIDFRNNIIKNVSEEKKMNENLGMIQRHFFSKESKSKITRTGVRWLWYMAYKLDGEKRYIEITHRNLDPIRAVFERSLGDDVVVLKAYIDFIKKLHIEKGKHLNDKQRSTVATHINCVGAVTKYGVFKSDELAEFMREQALYIIQR